MIITFIDALTKSAPWVATWEKSFTAERFAEVFLSYFRLQGLPDAIVSDQDPVQRRLLATLGQAMGYPDTSVHGIFPVDGG